MKPRVGWLFLMCGIVAAALSSPAGAVEQRPIELADIMAWRFMTSWALSDEGAWFGYHVGPTEGDGEVIFRQTQGEKEFKFGAGEVSRRAAAPMFSSDGKFAAYTIYPTHVQAAQARRLRRPLQNAVGILNLATGDRVEVAKVRRSALSGENPGWIALHKSAPEGGAPSAASDLLLRELTSGQEINVGNVSDFAFDKKGRYLVWIVDAQDKTGNGVYIRDMASGAVRALESDGRATYSRLSVSDEGDSLALLKGLDGRAPGEMRYFVLGFTGVGSTSPKRVTFNPATAEGFPAGMIVSPNRSPVWTKDQSALLFGIQKPTGKAAPPPAARDRNAPRPDPAAASATSDDADEKVDLVLWHWQDPRLQSQQQLQEAQDRNFNYLAEYRPAEKKFIRLADEEVRDVTPAPEQKFAIGRDGRAYELMANLDGRRFEDIYVIDLVTGKRTLAVKKSRWSRGASPTGTHFIYYDDGNFYAYDMVAGQATNITKTAPTSFIDTEDDHNVVKPPTQMWGWTSDGKYILLSDNWDIWQVAVDRSKAINLTVNGRKEQVRYRRPLDFDPEQAGFDLTKPLYLEIYGEWTKKGGIGVIAPGTTGVKRLTWDDATYAVPALMKARNANVYLYTRQTYKDPPDFYATTDEALTNAKPITHLAAGTEQFLMSSGSVLVSYVSAKGDKLQGALFLPANYEKGKTYPTILDIYQKESANLNAYTRLIQPNPTNINKAWYTSHGYAVFMPDITYKLNDPGMSAVWCIVPAVKAAIATGIVDAKHVGIMGHSWGGYETAFLITQTDMFAAAVASAPISDFISMYSLIYKATGAANGAMAESSQGRLTTGPWDNVESYTRNSPVLFVRNVKTPVLMLHNDRDGAVDFTQGVEYFNALRRLQKPVVMLEYPGETHGLAKRANGKDFMLRVMEFFDHYLMGKPMPKWYEAGVPWLEMEEHLKSRQVQKAAAPGEPAKPSGQQP